MTSWIRVCGSETDVPVEIETEPDGTVNLEEITAHFPGATTLKYKSSEQTVRSVKCSGGILRPPGGSWDAAEKYLVVIPVKPENSENAKQVATVASGLLQDIPFDFGRKRRFDEVECQMLSALAAQQHSTNQQQPMRKLKTSANSNKARDLIILGLSPSTTAQTIRDYFEKFGEIAMVQPKKSKDTNVSYSFIRFSHKSTEKKVLEESHNLDGRDIQVKIPDSQQEDKELRKVYVCYHESSIKEEEIKEYFEKFGEVAEVYVPKPWRHFCFVTFCEAEVAQSLVETEQILNGHTLYVKNQKNVKKPQSERVRSNFETEFTRGIIGWQQGDSSRYNLNTNYDRSSSSQQDMLQQYSLYQNFDNRDSRISGMSNGMIDNNLRGFKRDLGFMSIPPPCPPPTEFDSLRMPPSSHSTYSQHDLWRSSRYQGPRSTSQ